MSTIKSATCKDTSVQNTITTEESFQHFNYVFNGNIVTGIDADAIGDSSVNLESVSATLDEDITALEVQDAIRALKVTRPQVRMVYVENSINILMHVL